MLISNAVYEGGKLILTTDDVDAKKLVYNFKAGEYEIKKVYKKRSLDANAYCWALCTEIAKAIGTIKEEVYRQSIREGNYYTPITLHEDAVDEFIRIWETSGDKDKKKIGWFAEVVDKSPNGVLVFAYHGSSAYNTREMAELIDRLVQDAKSLDIDVMSERERSLLIEEWGK